MKDYQMEVSKYNIKMYFVLIKCKESLLDSFGIFSKFILNYIFKNIMIDHAVSERFLRFLFYYRLMNIQ